MIPRSTTQQDVEVYHLHNNPNFARQDLNCLLPLQRLAELEANSTIGRSAPNHYSYMGYDLQPDPLLEKAVPQIIQQLKNERVDIAVLVPARPICHWSIGLVQRKIEEAGISTVVISTIPALQPLSVYPAWLLWNIRLGEQWAHPVIRNAKWKS